VKDKTKTKTRKLATILSRTPNHNRKRTTRNKTP